MSDAPSSHEAGLGSSQKRSGAHRLDPADRIAIIVSAVWLFLSLLFISFVGIGGDGLGALTGLIVFVAIAFPLALIWIAAVALKGARIMREESERLQASIDAMRQLYISQTQMAATGAGAGVERRMDELIMAQKRTEAALGALLADRPASPEAPSPSRPVSVPNTRDDSIERQPGLALSTPRGAGDNPVSTADFITALNFPETADDAAGFDALRRALADHRAARLVRASQDTLTLLSQDGIYMDDLTPDRARPEIWRRFARGERGGAVAALGGIRDRSSLALSAGRMRNDSIFRDTVHHFLRTFDRTLSEVAEGLTDEEIVRFGDTRTARAFMLLGRVAGMFD